ncbi:hypothetical protein WM15_00245 [Burkholderia ubonensis]|nr:hypothetical protein WM15_00245 [Burkholderia ubonensis]
MGATFWSAAALAAAFCGSACAGAADFGNASDSVDTFASSAAHRRADALVRKMTLDEKLRFVHSQYEMSKVPGGGAGYIQGVPRLGIPDLNMVDSATGSGSTSQASTTFPATLAVAASWDRRLAYDYGTQVAIQLRAQGFGMGLGGGANLAREPRGGRLQGR